MIRLTANWLLAALLCCCPSTTQFCFVYARTLCRVNSRKRPHQNGLWGDGFPTGKRTPLCEGSISEDSSTGEICVTGRVNYEQIEDEIDDRIFSPANPTISVNGHLTAGSGNVVLGPNAFYLYDFITSYTINGTTISATSGSSMTDDMLAASKGTIDGFCLSGTIRDYPKRYRVRRRFRFPWDMDRDDLDDASIVYASFYAVFVERMDAVDDDNDFLDALLMPLSRAGASLNNFITGLPLPAWLLGLIPTFLTFTGLTRAILVNGRFNTERFPRPLTAPDVSVENWQLDCSWETFVSAVDAGLLDNPLIPINVGMIVKRIQGNGNACWTGEGASIDVQLPRQFGLTGMLDSYVTDSLYPALREHGPVSVHYGKRVVAASDPLLASVDFYESCGVSTGLSISKSDCYHPLCERNGEVKKFTYPEAYYDD